MKILETVKHIGEHYHCTSKDFRIILQGLEIFCTILIPPKGDDIYHICWRKSGSVSTKQISPIQMEALIRVYTDTHIEDSAANYEVLREALSWCDDSEQVQDYLKRAAKIAIQQGTKPV